MKVLYIGQYSVGTTSKMRAEKLGSLLNISRFDVVDIHVPFYNTSKVWRSIGFRYKKGPLIRKINKYISHQFKRANYDLIWVDKGIFIRESILRLLRDHTKKLVHFTPDPAFTFHQSKLFEKSIPYYDYLITTKSFELELYHAKTSSSKVIYTTQGFDKEIHIKPLNGNLKKEGVVFIGHHEDEREAAIKMLIENGIPVRLAGIKWGAFAKTHKENKYLNYLGEGVYGEEYVRQIQSAKIGWGAISKWIPEMHTTRTFEIPACGTALLTERNNETASFFEDDEAIFYDSMEDFLEKVKYYLNNGEKLKDLTCKGYRKVYDAGYDYENILENVLKTIMS